MAWTKYDDPIPYDSPIPYDGQDSGGAGGNWTRRHPSRGHWETTPAGSMVFVSAAQERRHKAAQRRRRELEIVLAVLFVLDED